MICGDEFAALSFTAPAAGLPPTRCRQSEQTMGLFALALMFLLYFHIDVQLQISSLPSIIALPSR
ncbi:MAG: hypothetical protein A3F75_11180 [Betaproteobacteria bacterium RIFCSPLOWO2_12_FULL_64_23]|nr:MAG: hypothetical protein A3F75_11180 [Betaproteobacteria bacterium RIFCSPLOWO2_12_FULL_64_23]